MIDTKNLAREIETLKVSVEREKRDIGDRERKLQRSVQEKDIKEDD